MIRGFIIGRRKLNNIHHAKENVDGRFRGQNKRNNRKGNRENKMQAQNLIVRKRNA